MFILRKIKYSFETIIVLFNDLNTQRCLHSRYKMDKQILKKVWLGKKFNTDIHSFFYFMSEKIDFISDYINKLKFKLIRKTPD